MCAFSFRFKLIDSNTKKVLNIDFNSSKEHILDAWKEASEYAWGEVNSHNRNWFVKEIVRTK